MAENRQSFWRRHRWFLWTGGGALALLAAVTTTVAILAHRVEPYVRARIVQGLSTHFHSHVELDDFHLSIGNGFRGEWGVWAQGGGLRIWPPSDVEGVEVPSEQAGKPLIQLMNFGFHAPLRYKAGVPINISDVRLQGLEIRMPPKSHFVHLSKPGGEDSANAQTAGPKPSGPGRSIQVHIGSIVCTNANLILETDKPGKLPREIAIARFKVTDVIPGSPMHFEADLTNPIPVGTIHTKGTFGPWQISDPADSPVSGDYRFENADLGTIKGIAGILTSTGKYQGTLRDITVDGVTDTPDFKLTSGDSSLPLHTDFHATVDGTDGDTWLDPVNATLGRSQIVARGQVVRVLGSGEDGKPHNIGHDIALKINVGSGRIEDFLRISAPGNAPILVGNVQVKTNLHIPPGAVPVVKKMALTDGNFSLTQAQFTSSKVQDRIAELSFRGQGKPGDAKSTPSDTIQWNMRGDFKLVSGTLSLPNLAFTVPGADVELSGTYGLSGGALNFTGVARLEAPVSKIVGGWKGLLLKPADRFFKKEGAGTAVPIHIRGTRKNPDFGVDLNRLKGSSPERPGAKPPQGTPASAPPA